MIRAKIGGRVKRAEDNSSNCGFLWARGADLADLEATLSRALEQLELIVDEEGT